MKKIVPILLPYVFILFAAGISFFRLNSSFIENWDEGFYADGMRNIITRREVIIPYWNHRPFFDKPPLYLWLGTLGRLAVGDSSAGYRFTSSVCIFLSMVLVFLYTQRKYGSVAATVAGLCLACNNVFVWRGRASNTDGLLTLLVLIIFLVSGQRFTWKYLVLGFLTSLVYMTKSTVVFFPILALVLLELSLLQQSKWQVTRQKIFDWAQALAAVLLIPVIWLTAGYLKSGGSFLQFYLLQSDNHASDITFRFFNLMYLKTILRSLNIFVLFVGTGLAVTLMSYQKPSALRLLVFSLLLPIALSFSPVRYHWYLMPAMPIWAIMVGFAIKELADWANKKKLSKLFAVGTLSLGVLCSGYVFHKSIWPLFWANSAYHQATSGQWLEAHSNPNDIVVRLDQFYPSLVFYSNRRVIVSDRDEATRDYFLSRKDLVAKASDGTFKWINGRNKDVALIAAQLQPGTYTIYRTTDEESVLHILRP